ncbi:MAG: AMP-dependent synthetase [Sphingomonadales bacterium RIFCSPHIGHO2_01_FULL_65_20]|jgi:acyl-CoA synthetase (AMP-forming)/AMP-acid ligase II|uniref:class I adenylate-forming enzyme family protein n=1 Tax=unclassified Blastomonas TaxID=2626550 RepID=UPI00082B1DB4|nr:acyl--CoA ligase [Blastomonas sp.]OHC96894.1 MAG: AMP-dependent synthetase [Sphingomonadales bacterium RIFCSPHIGHO2_01_FULL_65_20]
MATELDQMMDEAIQALTGEGGMLPLTTFEKYGQKLPMIASAPPALSHFFAYFCMQHADAEFLVDGETRLTFGQSYAAARHVAAALVAGHGIKKGDRVGIAARNSANWIIAYMGILMAGGVATLLNGWWQGPELCAGITDVDCTLVLADDRCAKRIAECGATGNARVVVISHDGPPEKGLASVLEAGGDAATELPELTGDDLATILFTSGSTGQSKGAYSDHRGVVQGVFSYVAQTLMALNIVTRQGKPPEGQPATLLNVPLFHVTAEVPVLLQSFVIGRKLVLMPKWDAEEAMRLIEKEKISYFVGVPLMSYEIAQHPNRDKYDLKTCVTFAAGGAPRPVEHVKRIKETMDWAFPILGYGLTETNGVGCGNFNENYMAKPDSTGQASRPLVDLAILDDNGHPLPQGQVGEVAIRSVANFLGYWNNEAATKAAIMPDGYFRTGDLGYLDADGYLFIVDRKKDIIIRGGENISCVEVESAIYAHPDIAEASVFGIPDERFGEIVGAVYVVREGASLNDEQLTEFLAGQLAAFKVPARLWQSAEALPRLGTAKIDKVSLRKSYQAAAKAEAGAAT